MPKRSIFRTDKNMNPTSLSSGRIGRMSKTRRKNISNAVLSGDGNSAKEEQESEKQVSSSSKQTTVVVWDSPKSNKNYSSLSYCIRKDQNTWALY